MPGLSLCPERKNMKKSIKILSLLLVLVTALMALAVPAFALSWDGSSAGGGGGGSPAGANGYAVRTTDDNCIGYRFSVVDKSGSNKVSKVIDVFRNTYYGNYECDNAYKFATKYNKKQLINNQNGNYSTSKNSTNCYKETNMGFATTLPAPSGMETWQNNTTNLNKILATLGVGSISNLKNGDKILVEPIYDVRLESVYHALTTTEIAIYGKHILGTSSNGGASSTSASWGFISEYTNRHYPNYLHTPDGQGLWTGVSASSSRLTFYNIINQGYGVGIAYTETKPDFTPALSVLKCEAWPGNVSTRNSNHFGTSTGNAFSYWTYGHGYPKSGDKIWYTVNFPAETENCYVKQSVWIVGGGSASRNVWSNSNTWYDFALTPTTVEAGKSYYTVKARVDWIDSSGTVKKYGTEKTFYIPIKPIVTREKVTAFNQESVAQAYSGSSGSSGKVYFGQKVTFQYLYGATSTWESSNNVTAIASRWNGTSWANIYTSNSGKDVSQTNIGLSKTKSYTKNSSIGTYTIPLPAKEDTNSYKLKFDLSTAWVTDTSHTTESSTYYIPVVKSDVELYDIKLVDSKGYYVDRYNLTVGDELKIHYVYRNNTDCTVYVKGYNDGGTQISGVFAIPAGETIEVEGRSYTVPNKRTFNIWGGVYLDTVARGNTEYETDGTNNQWLIVCKSNLPLTLTAVTPNAAYREKTTVISSFRLWNHSDDNYTPNENIKVRLRIYKYGETTPYKTLTKSAVVPAGENNLVYFKWYVPIGLNGENVTLKADIYDGSKYWNEISHDRSTTPYTYYTTPDTRYEEKAPTGFTVPTSPSAKSGSAKWTVYEYENGEFVKKTYAIAIKNDMKNAIEPATGSTATKSGSNWTMKSGYGIDLKSCSVMVSVDGYSSPDYTNSYTLPQYAYALLPEYNYTFASGKAVTLGKTTIDNYGYYVFPEDGTYGKVHFTPLWYPDGSYTVKVVQTDCWTPAGMISAYLITNPITISGNTYDDWYQGRR